jgi:photosystem II stability/assembly factor-like uncharacterized protein
MTKGPHIFVFPKSMNLIFKMAFILFCVHSSAFSLQIPYWTALPKPTLNTLSRVYFIDSVRGWIAGQYGTLMNTTNGGAKWNQLISGRSGEIPDIFVRTVNDLWSIEFQYPVDDTSWFGSNILHTTNGGQNWSIQRFDSTIFRSIVFLDSLTGFMGGSYGTIVKTINGGKTWYTVSDSSGHKFPIYKIKFFSKSYGYAVGGQLEIAGVIWRTTDGGETWRSKIVSGDPVFNLHYFDSLHVFCGMSDIDQSGAGFLRTIDGGINWTFENTMIWGEPTAFAFRTPTEGWVPMGIAAMCLKTTDQGLTWQQIIVPQQSTVYDISFPDERNGYMVGRNGALFKFNQEILSVGSEMNNDLHYALQQNFPNPFNGTTSISYELQKRTKVSIIVYDLLGRKIETLVDTEQQEGSHSIQWNSGNASSGVYFYRLIADEFVRSGKMILQR